MQDDDELPIIDMQVQSLNALQRRIKQCLSQDVCVVSVTKGYHSQAFTQDENREKETVGVKKFYSKFFSPLCYSFVSKRSSTSFFPVPHYYGSLLREFLFLQTVPRFFLVLLASLASLSCHPRSSPFLFRILTCLSLDSFCALDGNSLLHHSHILCNLFLSCSHTHAASLFSPSPLCAWSIRFEAHTRRRRRKNITPFPSHPVKKNFSY